jgi:hypothetical protein
VRTERVLAVGEDGCVDMSIGGGADASMGTS